MQVILEMPSEVAPAKKGKIELLTADFAIGWVAVNGDGTFSHVIASLDGRVIGDSKADILREDLESAKLLYDINGRAFVIAFYCPVEREAVARILVSVVETGLQLRKDETLRIEVNKPMRLFILGSPRSGTSQLGASLVDCLSLAWTGEAHVAPRFASAAMQLGGDPQSANDFVRALDRWNFRNIAIDAARKAYFFMHSASSFLDKTPGVDMVRSAPFIAECFRDAKFIFIRRHPISNVVSRMARFGGQFEEHCNDWSTTMLEWLRVRPDLECHLDIEQELMATAPSEVAGQITDFLGIPELKTRLQDSLSNSFIEQTGAGARCTSLSQTDWTEEQKQKFKSICDVTMRAFGYTAEGV